MPFIEGYKMGAIFQTAFTSSDLEATVTHFVDTLKIGPWFWTDTFHQPMIKYRGIETPGLQVAIAWAFSGPMQYEIIVQKDSGPSVFRDAYETTGYGLHHLAYFTDDFDAEQERFRADSVAIAFEVQMSPELGGKRVFYADTREKIGVMTEVGEYCDPVATMFARMHAESVGWDGKRPIRSLSDII
jgi:hypothetical protein